MPLLTTLSAFERSVSSSKPPKGLSPGLAALWWASKGKWQKAHEIVMNADDADCAWVHAYLHRAGSDLSNAGYWYGRAGKPVATGPLTDEWRAIAAALLEAHARSGGACR